MKQLWVLAGGNGAGKSTFYREALKPLGIPFINADQIAREIYPDDPEANSYNAAKIAEHMRAEQLLVQKRLSKQKIQAAISCAPHHNVL